MLREVVPNLGWLLGRQRRAFWFVPSDIVWCFLLLFLRSEILAQVECCACKSSDSTSLMESCQSACMRIYVRCGDASGLSSKSELQLQSCRIRTQSASGESRLAHGRYAREREGTGLTPHARFGLSLTISVKRMRTFSPDRATEPRFPRNLCALSLFGPLVHPLANDSCQDDVRIRRH